MFGSAVLEVLIGLVLVYLLLSVVCSSIGEGIATMLNKRGTTLRDAIARLLGEAAPSIAGKTAEGTAAIYKHPLIDALRQRESRDPSYIPNETFAAVLVDCIAPGGSLPPSARWDLIVRVVEDAKEQPLDAAIKLAGHRDLQASLQVIVQDVRQKFDAGLETKPADLLAELQLELCQWYERTMQRTTGWYKRASQTRLLFIAVGMTVLANGDSLMLARQLGRNPAMREAIAGAAQAYASAHTDGTQDAKALFDLTRENGLVLGYPDSALELARQAAAAPNARAFSWWLYGLGKLLGWMVTIFAVMLGAPFWFQTLEKLVKVRGSGAVPPPTSTTPTDNPPTEDQTAVAVVAGGTAAAISGPSNGRRAVRASAGVEPEPDDFRVGYWDDLVAGAKPMTSLPSKQADIELFSARLSALAYKPELLVKRVVEALGFTQFEFMNQSGTQAFAARCGDDLVIAFRGTEPSEIEDVVTDARTLLRSTCFGAGDLVHEGFHAARELIRGKLEAWLAAQGATAKRILFTGHSLGAALATLEFGLACKTVPDKVELDLITFGSPRVGDAKFVACLGDFMGAKPTRSIRRFVNNQDLVTRVAPRLMGYEHTGQVCWLDPNGRLVRDAKAIDEWNRFLALVVDAAFEFKAAAKSTVRDHGIHLYVAKLERAADDTRAA